MSVNDRGTIKWTSLMLPEHVNLLNTMWKEDEFKEKPILDEQKLIEIDLKLQCAIHNDLTVEIKYFKDRDYHTIKGKLLKIDLLNRKLLLNDESGTEIALGNVLDVYVD